MRRSLPRLWHLFGRLIARTALLPLPFPRPQPLRLMVVVAVAVAVAVMVVVWPTTVTPTPTPTATSLRPRAPNRLCARVADPGTSHAGALDSAVTRANRPVAVPLRPHGRAPRWWSPMRRQQQQQQQQQQQCVPHGGAGVVEIGGLAHHRGVDLTRAVPPLVTGEASHATLGDGANANSASVASVRGIMAVRRRVPLLFHQWRPRCRLRRLRRLRQAVPLRHLHLQRRHCHLFPLPPPPLPLPPSLLLLLLLHLPPHRPRLRR